MSEDGLGTLAVLPREVRDIISSYVAATVKYSDPTYRAWCFRKEIRLCAFVRVSKQLRQEFFESFLRHNDFSIDYFPGSIGEMNNFLRHVSPMTDVATHIRALGIRMKSHLFDEYKDDFTTIQASQINRPHEIHWVFRRLRRLRSCFDVYSIPLHKLYIEMTYILPLYIDWTARNGPFWNTILQKYLQQYRKIKIDISSKVRSIAALEQEYDRILLDWQNKLDMHLDMVQEAVKDDKQDDDWIADQRELNTSCKRIISALASSILEHHKKLIDQVIQFWQEADDFDEYCLGDFFALAEAW